MLPVSFEQLSSLTWEDANDDGQFMLVKPTSKVTSRKGKRYTRSTLLDGEYIFVSAVDAEDPYLDESAPQDFYLFEDHVAEKIDLLPGEPDLEKYASRRLSNEETKEMVDDLIARGYVIVSNMLSDEEEEPPYLPTKDLIPLEFKDLSLFSSFEEANNEGEFILLRPEDPVKGRVSENDDKTIDVNAPYMFYSSGLWNEYNPEDEYDPEPEEDETRTPFYLFENAVVQNIDVNSEVKDMKRYGMKPMSYEEVKLTVERLLRQGYVLARDTVKASPIKAVSPKASPIKAVSPKASPIKAVSPKASPIKAVSPKASPIKAVSPKASPIKAVSPKASPIKSSPGVNGKTRLLYNLYDFEHEGSRRDAVNKMIEYGTIGFLDPYSFAIISIPEVSETYISAKLANKFPELTYTDNVLLNSLKSGQFSDYGAIVPDELFSLVKKHVPVEHRRDFETGNESLKIEKILKKDTNELLSNYSEYEIWWETPSFVRELELRHGLPLTGDAVRFARSFMAKDVSISDAITVNAMLEKSVPFNVEVVAESFEFKVRDLNFKKCVTPTSLDAALYLIVNKEELSSRQMIDHFCELLEIGGYYRYRAVEEAIPGYFREDYASGAEAYQFWKKYITTIFRFGDSTSISACCRTYKKIVVQFEDNELFEIFMKRGIKMYNFFMGNAERYFGKEIGNVSNKVIAKSLPYLDDDFAIERYFDEDEYPEFLDNEYLQLMMESAIQISEDVFRYFANKAKDANLDVAALYHVALKSGFPGSLGMILKSFGSASVNVDPEEVNSASKIRFCLENLGGVDDMRLVNYICRRYRGVDWIDLLRLVKFDHGASTNLCLSKQNPLTAIAIGLM